MTAGESFQPGDEVEATIRGVAYPNEVGGYISNGRVTWLIGDCLSVQRVVKPREVGSWWKDSAGMTLRWMPAHVGAAYPWRSTVGEYVAEGGVAYPIERVVFTPTGDVETGPK